MAVLVVNWLSTIVIFLLTGEALLLRRLHIVDGTDILGVLFAALFALPGVSVLLGTTVARLLIDFSTSGAFAATGRPAIRQHDRCVRIALLAHARAHLWPPDLVGILPNVIIISCVSFYQFVATDEANTTRALADFV